MLKTKEQRMSDCPHGFEIGKNRLPAGSYAAPIGTCRCCGTGFVYIASSQMGGRQLGHEPPRPHEERENSPDPTLCPQCGGKPRRYHRVGDDVLINEPGSAGRKLGMKE